MCTYPIPPVACVVAIRLAVEVVHGARLLSAACSREEEEEGVAVRVVCRVRPPAGWGSAIRREHGSGRGCGGELRARLVGWELHVHPTFQSCFSAPVALVHWPSSARPMDVSTLERPQTAPLNL